MGMSISVGETGAYRMNIDGNDISMEFWNPYSDLDSSV